MSSVREKITIEFDETLTTIDDETIDLSRVIIKRINELMDESVTRRTTGIYFGVTVMGGA